MFSRNASSSRAIPSKVLLKQVRENPAMPTRFGGNQPGMQDTGVEHDGLVSWKHEGEVMSTTGRGAWHEAANRAADMAEAMMNAGYHKQVANRLLEPFCRISVVVTATEWANFFELRAHPAAEPSIQELALAMGQALDNSTPKLLKYNEWHLPYVGDDEKALYDPATRRAISVARCARVSYLTHEGTVPDVEKDKQLCEKLMGAHPRHASPAEHQARCRPSPNEFYANFRGWQSYRNMLETLK